MTEERRGPPHVRADRYRPDGQLIPREQIAGEGQQQREDQQCHPNHPVKLTGGLIRPGHEDAEHVQPDRDHHPMRRPAMHVAHQHPEGHVEFEILEVRVGIFRYRPVVEHEVNTRHHRHQKHEKGDPPHAPREPQPGGVLADLGGMEVQPHVPRDHEDAVAWGILIAVAENRLPRLRFHDLPLEFIPLAHTSHTFRMLSGCCLLGSTPGCMRNTLLLSTTNWPSSPRRISTRSMGRGAGPSKL